MTGLKNIIRSMKGNRSLYSSLLLQTVIVLISISIISAELFHLHRDPSVGNVNLEPNKNQVTTYDECKKYLCKYGYLSCNCQEELLRKKRDLPENMFPTEYGVEDDVISTPRPADYQQTTADSMSACTHADFENGLRTFQKNYRLDVTGTCDTRTTDQMSKRRCGQPDTVIDRLDSDPVDDETSVSRDKRSLTSILTHTTKLEQSIDRRKRQLQDYIKQVEDEQATPGHSAEASNRDKRSVISVTSNDDYGGLLTKRRVSWRLMSDHYSHIIAPQSQRGILKQAFRYWSEVAPLCFYEDTDSNDRVDIEIGFLEGVHLSCYRQFDGFGGEIAHKYYRDVHFDNSEPYTVELTSDTRISLLLVAVHELGHVIGLNHSNVDNSVMNAIYHQSIRGDFELSLHDRREVKKAYGPCSGKFDMAFDLVRSKPGLAASRIYNSFFFRGDHYWMYENNNQRARFGDPLLVSPEWQGLPSNLDAFLHYWEYSYASRAFTDEYYFFKGEEYWVYNAQTDVATRGGLIRNKWRAHNSTSTQMPVNIDSAFYDWRNNVNLVYFFKGDQVYSYDYKLTGQHSCCASQQSIVQLFPPATPGDLTSPTGNSYAQNVDSIFYSYYHQSMYIVKGDDLWRNELWSRTTSTNSMKYIGKWFEVWPFICDGECS